MIRSRRHAAVFAAAIGTAVGVAPPARADDAAVSAPRPAKEIDSLKFLVGSWKCEGRRAASPFGPEHGTRASVKIQLGEDGFWIRSSYDEKKDKDNPQPFHAADQFTFHTGMKKFVRIWTSALGDFGVTTADAWDGNKLVFSGEQHLADGTRTGSRYTVTKHADKKVEFALEMQKKDGAWASIGGGTCTR